MAPLLGKLGCLWDSDAFPAAWFTELRESCMCCAMRWSRLLWLRLWLAALLVWVRCRADGEEQRHQAARLAVAGTGDGGGHSSTPLSQCTYTFILPEMMTGATQPSCPGRGEPTLGGNSLLGEAAEETHSPVGQRVQHLELAIENYTHWIQQVSGLGVGKGV